jgi:hypothetical protein
MQQNVPISIDALAAMRTLVQAGVSDEAIGRALRDLLLASSEDVLVTMSSSPRAEQQPPDGPAIGTPTLHPETPAAPSVAAPAAPVLAGAVPLKVRFADGKTSNVTIPAQLLYRVAKKLGGDDAARRRVRDLALDVPENTSNRSGWIQSALNALVSVP